MKTLKQLLDNIFNRDISVTNELIKQTERNAMKAEILEAITKDLPKNVVIGRAKDGICLRLENENEGSIPVVLDITIKKLDTDLEGMVQEYEKKQKEKQEKAEKRKRERQASYKNQMAKKKMLEEKKANEKN